MSRTAMEVAIRAPTRRPLLAPQCPSKSVVRLQSSTRRQSAQMFLKSLALQVPGRFAVTCPSRTASLSQRRPTARTFRRSCVANALISTQSQSHVRSVDLALHSIPEERRERRAESERTKSAILVIFSIVDFYRVVLSCQKTVPMSIINISCKNMYKPFTMPPLPFLFCLQVYDYFVCKFMISIS